MDKGYYSGIQNRRLGQWWLSQSTIKMDKGYYWDTEVFSWNKVSSQSTIKMDKGYYTTNDLYYDELSKVAIHNKNGQGLLHYLD